MQLMNFFHYAVGAGQNADRCFAHGLNADHDETLKDGEQHHDEDAHHNADVRPN